MFEWIFISVIDQVVTGRCQVIPEPMPGFTLSFSTCKYVWKSNFLSDMGIIMKNVKPYLFRIYFIWCKLLSVFYNQDYVTLLYTQIYKDKSKICILRSNYSTIKRVWEQNLQGIIFLMIFLQTRCAVWVKTACTVFGKTKNIKYIKRIQCEDALHSYIH